MALELIAARDAEPERVVGVAGGEQRFHHGFADLLAGRWARFAVGAVDRANLPTGPDRNRRAISFGVRLLRDDGVPLAVLQRQAASCAGRSCRSPVRPTNSRTRASRSCTGPT